jgi:hypothetical protein
MEMWRVKSPWVYLIECVGHDIIKIGCTSNGVKHRLIDLQRTCPFELVCVGAYAADPTEEKRLHNEFAAHRIRGEWFSATAELRSLIAAKCPDFDLSAVDTISLVPEARDRLLAHMNAGKRRHVHERHRRRLALQSLANKHRIPMLAFDQWMEGKRYPTMKMLGIVDLFLEAESLHALEVDA